MQVFHSCPRKYGSVLGDAGELLLGIGGVKIFCGGVDQFSVAVINAEGISAVAQIVPQAVVLSLQQSGIAQHSYPVRRDIDGIKVVIPERKNPSGNQQQSQCEKQIASGQQPEQTSGTLVIFQAYTPILSR